MYIRYDLVDARDEIKMHPEEFYYDPSDKGKLDKLIDELTKSKDKCLEVVYKFDDSVILIKHEFEDKNTGRTIYETINEVADAAAACCDCIGSIINSATKVKVLNKSVETARAAGVPEDKILKSKKDIDNYFNK